ncbi:MAG: hypothetical protein ACK5L0_04850 [Candidatus Fimivivens sp.]
MSKNKDAPTFSGRELIRVARGLQRDILTVVLQPDTEYTEAQASTLATQYLSKEVR